MICTSNSSSPTLPPWHSLRPLHEFLQIGSLFGSLLGLCSPRRHPSIHCSTLSVIAWFAFRHATPSSVFRLPSTPATVKDGEWSPGVLGSTSSTTFGVASSSSSSRNYEGYIHVNRGFLLSYLQKDNIHSMDIDTRQLVVLSQNIFLTYERWWWDVTLLFWLRTWPRIVSFSSLVLPRQKDLCSSTSSSSACLLEVPRFSLLGPARLWALLT